MEMDIDLFLLYGLNMSTQPLSLHCSKKSTTPNPLHWLIKPWSIGDCESLFPDSIDQPRLYFFAILATCSFFSQLCVILTSRRLGTHCRDPRYLVLWKRSLIVKNILKYRKGTLMVIFLMFYYVLCFSVKCIHLLLSHLHCNLLV